MSRMSRMSGYSSVPNLAGRYDPKPVTNIAFTFDWNEFLERAMPHAPIGETPEKAKVRTHANQALTNWLEAQRQSVREITGIYPKAFFTIPLDKKTLRREMDGIAINEKPYDGCSLLFYQAFYLICSGLVEPEYWSQETLITPFFVDGNEECFLSVKVDDAYVDISSHEKDFRYRNIVRSLQYVRLGRLNNNSLDKIDELKQRFEIRKKRYEQNGCLDEEKQGLRFSDVDMLYLQMQAFSEKNYYSQAPYLPTQQDERGQFHYCASSPQRAQQAVAFFKDRPYLIPSDVALIVSVATFSPESRLTIKDVKRIEGVGKRYTPDDVLKMLKKTLDPIRSRDEHVDEVSEEILFAQGLVNACKEADYIMQYGDNWRSMKERDEKAERASFNQAHPGGENQRCTNGNGAQPKILSAKEWQRKYYKENGIPWPLTPSIARRIHRQFCGGVSGVVLLSVSAASCLIFSVLSSPGMLLASHPAMIATAVFAALSLIALIPVSANLHKSRRLVSRINLDGELRLSERQKLQDANDKEMLDLAIANIPNYGESGC